MMFLNFCLYAYAMLVIVHGIGSPNYLEAFGGIVLLIGVFLLKRNYFFYVLIGLLLVVFGSFYGYTFAKGITFFPAIAAIATFFLILGVLFEILNVYLKK